MPKDLQDTRWTVSIIDLGGVFRNLHFKTKEAAVAMFHKIHNFRTSKKPKIFEDEFGHMATIYPGTLQNLYLQNLDYTQTRLQTKSLELSIRSQQAALELDAPWKQKDEDGEND